MFKMYMNNHHGKSFKGVSFREPGLYGDREKWTLILAIDSTGKKVFTLRKVAGTSTEDFAVFVNKILASSMCPVGGAPRTFMWDNLRSHKSARIINLVYNAGHRIVCRPPYRPQDGPIEYAFNMLEQELPHHLHTVTDDASFVQVQSTTFEHFAAHRMCTAQNFSNSVINIHTCSHVASHVETLMPVACLPPLGHNQHHLQPAWVRCNVPTLRVLSYNT
jgi:hypothetical protein